MTKIPVNSIVIPERFVSLCHDWNGGLEDMLYAVSSTGNLTTGEIRPWRYDSDEEWYYSLWCDLFTSVWIATRAAEKGYNAEDDGGDGDGHDADYPTLVEFGKYVDSIVERLENSYGFND